MPFQTRYVLIVSMDVKPDKEALFNEVYDTEHVPTLRDVPGVAAVYRLVNRPLQLCIGGELRQVDTSGEPGYSAVYEIETPEVLTSDAWAKAVEHGRWPQQVRPFTFNRRHVLREVLQPGG